MGKVGHPYPKPSVHLHTMINTSDIRYTTTSALLILALSCASAQAGTVSAGQWAPTGCGAKPVAPTLDLSSADAYNKSVDGVNAYRQAIRPYLDCLVKEANADIGIISKSATVAQVSAKEANDKIQADVKAAEEKLK